MANETQPPRGPYNTDTSVLSSLRESINEAAKRLHTTLIWFLALMSYFILTVAGTTQEQILIGGSISVPALSVTMLMELFYLFAPIAVLLLHVYVFIQISPLINRYRDFHQELKFASDKEQSLQRNLLLPTLLTFSILGPKQSAVMRALAMLILGGACFLLPLCGLLYCQIHFLPYHSTFFTGLHSKIVVIDGLISISFAVWSLNQTGPISAADMKKPAKYSQWSNVIVYAYLAGFIGIPLYVSVFDAQIPNPSAALDWNFLDSMSHKGLRNLTLPKGFKVLTAAGTDRVVDLSKRDLRGADLRGVDFTGVNLEEAQLQGAWLAGAKFINANLDKAHLERAKAKSAQFDGANLALANFQGIYAEGADFSGANIWAAHFEFAWLKHADFNAANIGSHFRGAFLDNTSFCGAIISFSDFTGASLRSADFCSAGMATQEFPEFDRDVHAPQKLIPINKAAQPDLSFARADLTDAKLDGVDFELADFTGADLANIRSGAGRREALEETGKQVYQIIPEGRLRMATDLRLKYAEDRTAPRLPSSVLSLVNAPGVGQPDNTENWVSTGVEFANLMCREPSFRTDFLLGVGLLQSEGLLNDRFRAIARGIDSKVSEGSDCKFTTAELDRLRSFEKVQVSQSE